MQQTMCEICVRKSKHLGSPRTVSNGLIRHIAVSVVHYGYCITPLFRETSANIALEAEIHRLRRNATYRKRRNVNFDGE